MNLEATRILIVGYEASYHLGAHFYRAAQQIGMQVKLVDPSPAFDSPWLLRQINWRLLGHRPPRLATFSQKLVDLCGEFAPDMLLVLGIAPVQPASISWCRNQGVICLNYLTDDPWNPAHRSQRHFKALPEYSLVFSPRRANLADLRSLGCNVEYLPFGYEPTLHFPEDVPPLHQQAFECEVMFYGGADSDRVPSAKAIIEAGHKLNLYGGYWERYKDTQSYAKGHVLGERLRWAVSGAEVSICLVRRANRDGHVMRTYEVPAMGGCMLTEDTAEHREIFGPEGENTLYFGSIDEMIAKLQLLHGDADLRQKLAQNAHNHIVSGHNTYYDRLMKMVEHVQELDGVREHS